jgi:ribosomal protein S27E
MTPQTSFEPGEWYLLITCKHCGGKQILLDPSRGKTIVPDYSTCPDCLRKTQYSGDLVERYQHESALPI